MNEPFKVPEGYFDSFADRLQSRIEKLPQAKMQTKHVHLVPKAWFAAAASIVVVASVGLSIMLPRWKGGQPETSNMAQTEMANVTESNTAEAEDGYIYDELDYAMIDNNEIAYYLTEY